jgi:peroxiredoxin
MKHTDLSNAPRVLDAVQNMPRRCFVAAAISAPAVTIMGCSQDVGLSVADSPFTVLSGQQTTFRQLPARAVLVNFWATSCTTCVAEMPELMATYQRFAARGYDTVAVAMQYDPPAYVMDFAKTRRLPFQVTMDVDGRLAHDFGNVQITPTSFLLDANRRVIKRIVGRPDFVALHEEIEQLLRA